MSVNKVILLGRAGKDPLVSHVHGIKKANFSLATSERGYTNSAGAQVPERTDWHNLVAWNAKAEVCEKYVRRGDLLYIEGKLTTRSWDDNGQKRYITEIIVEVLELFQKQQPAHQQVSYAQAPAPPSQGNLWDDPTAPY